MDRRGFMKWFGGAVAAGAAAPVIAKLPAPAVLVKAEGVSGTSVAPAMLRRRVLAEVAGGDSFPGCYIRSVQLSGDREYHQDILIGRQEVDFRFGIRRENLRVEAYLTKDAREFMDAMFCNGERVHLKSSTMPEIDGSWVPTQRSIKSVYDEDVLVELEFIKVAALNSR